MIKNLIKIIDLLNNYNCPWIGFGNDEETSIETQWRKNEKAITIFLEDNRIYYLKSWGPRIIDDMEDGEIAEISEIKSLLNWVYD